MYSNLASVKKNERNKQWWYVDYFTYKKVQNMLDDLQDSYFIDKKRLKKI